MNLKHFIRAFIEPNTIIRLVYNIPGGHETVGETWSDVAMEWETRRGEGIYKKFIGKRVLGVTDIVTSTNREAVNIVIKK